jgi:hypothetical protein
MEHALKAREGEKSYFVPLYHCTIVYKGYIIYIFYLEIIKKIYIYREVKGQRGHT